MDQDCMRLYAESVRAIAKQIDLATGVMTCVSLGRALGEMTDGVLKRLDGDAAAPIPHIRAAE